MTPITMEEYIKIESGRNLHTSKFEKELVDFLDSDSPAAELNTFGVKQPSCRYAALAKRKNLPITIIGRGGKVYAFYSETDRGQNADESEWAKRLAYYVNSCEYDPPKDILQTAETAIDTLRDREKTVILMRYKDGMTLGEIGNHFGLTRERIRQIEKKAIMKLGAKSLRRKWLIGLEEDERISKEAEEQREQRRIEAQKAFEEEERQRIAKEFELSQNAELCGTAFMNTPLEDLDLDVRSFNCLMRFSDIRTIGQLIEKKLSLGDDAFYDWLLSLTQLGRKTAEHIIDRIN